MLTKVINIFSRSGPALSDKEPFLKAEMGQQWLWAALCGEPFFSHLCCSGGAIWIENCLNLQNGNLHGLDIDVMHLSHPSYERSKAFSRDCSAPVIPASLCSLGVYHGLEWFRVSGATLA